MAEGGIFLAWVLVLGAVVLGALMLIWNGARRLWR
jgi:hypothetical protein